MKIFLAIFSFLLLFFSCQKEKQIQKKIDSTDQLKITTWYNNINSISKSFPDSIAIYADKMEQLAINQPNEYQSMAAFMKGVYHSNQAQYQLSNKQYETAFQLLENSKADTLQAKIYLGLGNNFKYLGDYPKAFENLYKALKIFEKHKKNVGICNALNIIGEINFQKGNVTLAKENIEKALAIMENDNSNLAYLSAAHSLANVYGMNGEFENAIKIDEKCIRITDSINSPKMKVAFLDNKANCYLFSNRLDSAQYYFQECLKLDYQIGNEKQIADTYSNLGQLYLLKNDFNTAEQFTLKSISMLEKVDVKPNLDKAYSILVSIYNKQQQFKKAFDLQRKQFENYKAMINEREAASFAEFKSLYETQKKESKIKSLEQEGKIRKLKIVEQAAAINKRNFFIVVIVILLIGLLTVTYFWKRKQALQNILIEERIIRNTEEKERIRIAKDIHDDLGSGLSKIKFLSEIIQQKTTEQPEVQSSSESVKETASKMIENMRDLIWALNPDNSTLANLIARMREYATDYLEDYTIEVNYDFPTNIPQTPITKESQRELFMVIKESLNNIVKHSASSVVNFSIQLDDKFIKLVINDNGKGFLKSEKVSGNGLRNMQSRIAQIGGLIEIESVVNNGTTISLSLALDKILKNNSLK